MRNPLRNFDRLFASNFDRLFASNFGRIRASRFWHFPRKTIVALITLYQHTLSPDHGPLRHLYTYGYCRHSPTCSEFGKQAILSRGVIIGGIMTIGRVITCTPWRKPSPERIMEISHHSRE